jgi:hypothetical protein
VSAQAPRHRKPSPYFRRSRKPIVNRSNDADLHMLRILISPELFGYLHRHSQGLRRVSVSRLVRDVMTFWVLEMTDFTDAYFAPERMGLERSPQVDPEPHAGYFKGLGFRARSETTTAAFTRALKNEEE